jgi:phage gp29-like protein
MTGPVVSLTSSWTVDRLELRALAVDMERAAHVAATVAGKLRAIIGDDYSLFPPGTWVGSEQKHIDEQQAKIDGLRKQAEAIIGRIDDHLSRR